MKHLVLSEKDIARFESKIQRGAEDECHLWLGSISERGYGWMKVRGRKRYAHQIAYALANGGPPPPDRPHVLHKCPIKHNPACVNAKHLQAGTHRENMQDKSKAGNSGNMRGEAHGRAKLTDSDVRTIRQRAANGPHGTKSQLAREYGVAKSVISAIVLRQRWGHVE